MPALSAFRYATIRDKARSLLLKLWANRREAGYQTDSVDSMIPIPTDKIIRTCLRIALEEPEVIAPLSSGVETAGFIDRVHRRIGISQKYPQELRRFTMAHEIGHWVLHDDMNLHRDRPITGGERANGARPIVELEADCFAAELLMPRKQLTAYFQKHFGELIPTDVCDVQERVFWLQSGRGRQVDAILFREDRRYRSLIIAQARYSGPGTPFRSLAERFGVSPTAMAIQLEDTALVI